MPEVNPFEFTDNIQFINNPKGSGAKRRIESPESLWQLFEEYDNDKCRDQIEEVQTKIGIIEKTVRVPRTLSGFRAFLKLPKTTWNDYKNREEFAEIIEIIEGQCEADLETGGLMNKYNSKLTEKALQHEHGRREQVDVSHEVGFSWDEILNAPAQKKLSD